MTRPRLLDLYSGGGGAAAGYIAAGFEVVGVDVVDHSAYYPGEFVQGDALQFARDHAHEFDAVHASPVCKRYSTATGAQHRDKHPDQVANAREVLTGTGLPWVMENVPQAPLRRDLLLCGSHFDLVSGGHLLKRHRVFELEGFEVPQPACTCRDGRPVAGVYGDLSNAGFKRYHTKRGGVKFPLAHARAVMGVDLPAKPLSQAIPAAYSRYIGNYLYWSLGAENARRLFDGKDVAA